MGKRNKDDTFPSKKKKAKKRDISRWKRDSFFQ